jgi:hypothetical protein
MTQALTIDETAAALRTTRRWLLEWLRKHPADKQGLAYFTPVGRDKIFHPVDIQRIELALREGVQCRSVSGRRAPAKRPTTKSAARTSDSEWRLAAELTNDPSLAQGCARSKSASSGTDNTRPRPRLSLVPGSQPS